VETVAATFRVVSRISVFAGVASEKRAQFVNHFCEQINAQYAQHARAREQDRDRHRGKRLERVKTKKKSVRQKL